MSNMHKNQGTANKGLTGKDIADLRLALIRGLSINVDMVEGAGAFADTFVPVLGELLARADAFETIRSMMSINVDETSAERLQYIHRRIRETIQDFEELLARSERLSLAKTWSC